MTLGRPGPAQRTERRASVRRLLSERPQLWGAAAVALAGSATWAAVGKPTILLVAGGVVLTALLLTREAALGTALVASTFLSRFHLDAGGFALRPEIPIAALTAVSLIMSRSREARPALTRIVFLLLAWLAALFVSSSLFAPDPGSSLRLVVWLLLGILAFMWTATRPTPILVVILKAGLLAGLASQILGIVCWIGAFTGSFLLFVQPDPSYGGYAAYGMTIEANILAGLTTLWAVVGMSSRVATLVGWRTIRVLAVVLAPITSIAAHTRAAFIVSVALCVFLALRGSGRYQLALIAPVAAVACWVSLELIGTVPGLDKFTELFDFNSGTGAYRAASWLQALHDLSVDPSAWLTGFGVNAFGQKHLDPTAWTAGAPWFLSNLPLQVLYDGGLVAVVLLGLAFGLLTTQTNGATRLFFLAAYIALGSQATTLWLLQTWIFVGLYAVVCRTPHAPEGGRNADDSELSTVGHRPAEVAVTTGSPRSPALLLSGDRSERSRIDRLTRARNV